MAKRSRRARRQERQKQKRRRAVQQPPASPAPAAEAEPRESGPSPAQADPLISRPRIDFAQEYFYVYNDLKSFLIISVLMFVLLVGLSFVI